MRTAWDYKQKACHIVSDNSLCHQECLKLCQEDKDCEYFTQFDLENVCYGFASCEDLSTDTCELCYSGNTSCPGRHELFCYMNYLS